MTRRRLLAGGVIAGLAGLSTGSRSQPAGRTVLIGMLGLGSPETLATGYGPFDEALRNLGYIEGRNARIERRFAYGKGELLAPLAKELVSLRPDVLVAGSNREIGALKAATDTIPIVMAIAADPVGAGFVASLGRPGGNVTGVAGTAGVTLFGKRLELLKDIVPGLRRVAVLRTQGEVSDEVWADFERGATALGLTLVVAEVRSLDGYDAAFASLVESRPGGLALVGSSLITLGKRKIIDFALRNRLPSVWALKDFARYGMLITYGVDQGANYRRAAEFVDRILRGARPADLPVEQPVRYEMFVNMKTARAIGVKIPQSVLLRADEVIE